MALVQDKKISGLDLIALIPQTSTTVLQDGKGGNEQATITGQSIQTNHSPVNYTTAGTEITQNIAGIDNALGALGGNTVSFSVYQSVAQSIPDSALTTVNFQSKNFDNGNYFNSNKHNPKVAGTYCYFFQCAWSSTGSSNVGVLSSITKNGSIIGAQTAVISIPATTIGVVPLLMVELEMNGTTDYVECVVQQTQAVGSASLFLNNTQNQLYFCGALLNQKGSAASGAVVLNAVYVSGGINGSDIDGTGSIIAPFKTREGAIDYIAGAQSSTNRYAIMYDLADYTPSSFILYPWIYDYVPVGIGWAGFTVGNSQITLATEWNGITGTYLMQGLVFDPSTSFALDTTSLSGTTANLYLYDSTISASGVIIGTNNTLNLNLRTSTFLGNTTLTNITSLQSGGENTFNGLAISNTGSKHCLGKFGNDLGFGAVAITSGGTGDCNYTFQNSSPPTSIALTQTSGNTLEYSADATSWKSPTIVGTPTITLLTIADSINSNYPSPTHYTPVSADVKGHLQGINTALGSSGGVVNLRTVNYSTTGNDSTGTGTITNPFATLLASLTHALTLTPTVNSPILIHGDPGRYSITTAGILYPNIYYGGIGVIWTQSGISTITFASSAAWSGSFANVELNDIEIDASLTLNLDSTGITNFNTTVTLGDGLIAQNGPIFKKGNAGHIYSLQLNDAVTLDTEGTGVTIDGVDTYGYGAHQISNGGALAFLTTNTGATFLSVGNAGIGGITLTTSGSNSFIFSAYAGNQVNFGGGVVANGSGGVQIFRDATTWTSNTNYSGTHASTVLDENISLADTGASLNYGATTNWDARSNFAAALELTGDTIMANPTGLIGPQDYSLDVTMDATGGRSITSWGANFQFPTGIPSLNTAANATTSFLFHSPDGTLMICRSPAGYKAPILATTSLPSTLISNTTYYLDSTSVLSKTLPASPNLGDMVKVRINNGTGILTVSLNGGQSMVFGNVSPTTSVTSTAKGDAMTFEATTSGSSCIWLAIAETGNWNWT